MNSRPEGGYQPRATTGAVKPPPKDHNGVHGRPQSERSIADVNRIREITEKAVTALIGEIMLSIIKAAERGDSALHVPINLLSQKHQDKIAKHFTSEGFTFSMRGIGPWPPAMIIRW